MLPLPFAEVWENEKFLRACEAQDLKPTKHVLRVRVCQQKLEHWVCSEASGTAYTLLRSYTVSTGRRPPSCIENSLGTPTGLHAVCEKIGDGQPEGMVFKGRVPTGFHYADAPEEDRSRSLVTTRILRLRGLEPGHNSGPGCDTYARYVYIHGTNREDLLGQPATHGCTTLSNQEMIALHDATPSGSMVWIEVLPD